MKGKRDRDRAVSRLLQARLRARAASSSSVLCPDAETLAAWLDGGLGAADRTRAEAHVGDCARCQAQLAAMARMPSVLPTQAPRWTANRVWAWLVPLTAGAAAIVVWVWVQPGRAPAREGTPQPVSTKPVDEVAEKPAEQFSEKAPATRPPRLAPRQTQRVAGGEVERLRRRQDVGAAEPPMARAEPASAPPAAAAPASAPPAAPARNAALAGTASVAKTTVAERVMIDIVSPEPSTRWRVTGVGIVQRSTDAGSTWETQFTGVAAQLTAGASPEPSMCWLVGRAGVVLLSIDGRSWRRLPFPEAVDLIAIRALDHRTATVTAADGRAFETRDGGRTWAPLPLRENSPAPF